MSIARPRATPVTPPNAMSFSNRDDSIKMWITSASLEPCMPRAQPRGISHPAQDRTRDIRLTVVRVASPKRHNTITCTRRLHCTRMLAVISETQERNFVTKSVLINIGRAPKKSWLRPRQSSKLAPACLAVFRHHAFYVQPQPTQPNVISRSPSPLP